MAVVAPLKAVHRDGDHACPLIPGHANQGLNTTKTLFISTAGHPALKREDRLGKDQFAGFGTVVEDITGSGYTKNQPILLGAF